MSVVRERGRVWHFLGRETTTEQESGEQAARTLVYFQIQAGQQQYFPQKEIVARVKKRGLHLSLPHRIAEVAGAGASLRERGTEHTHTCASRMTATNLELTSQKFESHALREILIPSYPCGVIMASKGSVRTQWSDETARAGGGRANVARRRVWVQGCGQTHHH